MIPSKLHREERGRDAIGFVCSNNIVTVDCNPPRSIVLPGQDILWEG